MIHYTYLLKIKTFLFSLESFSPRRTRTWPRGTAWTTSWCTCARHCC